MSNIKRKLRISQKKNYISTFLIENKYP